MQAFDKWACSRVQQASASVTKSKINKIVKSHAVEVAVQILPAVDPNPVHHASTSLEQLCFSNAPASRTAVIP
jgi:hypothetical protein